MRFKNKCKFIYYLKIYTFYKKSLYILIKLLLFFKKYFSKAFSIMISFFSWFLFFLLPLSRIKPIFYILSLSFICSFILIYKYFSYQILIHPTFLGFYGNIISSLISGSLSFLGLYLTIRYYERRFKKENQKEIEQIELKSNYSVFPLFKYHFINFTQDDDNLIVERFKKISKQFLSNENINPYVLLNSNKHIYYEIDSVADLKLLILIKNIGIGVANKFKCFCEIKTNSDSDIKGITRSKINPQLFKPLDFNYIENPNTANVYEFTNNDCILPNENYPLISKISIPSFLFTDYFKNFPNEQSSYLCLIIKFQITYVDLYDKSYHQTCIFELTLNMSNRILIEKMVNTPFTFSLENISEVSVKS